jgi:hypothetical protein
VQSKRAHRMLFPVELEARQLDRRRDVILDLHARG